MKQVNVKNIKAILGKDYPVDENICRAIQNGAWSNTFKVVKEAGWFLQCETYVDGKWQSTTVESLGSRSELVEQKRQLEAAFVRPLHLVKRDLDKWWSKQVSDRDKGKCILCGSTDKCSAHHWYINANRSRMARWEVANGIWLCFGCHMRIAHERPDYRTYRTFYEHVRRKFCKTNETSNMLIFKIKFKKTVRRLDELSGMFVTDELVRKLWVEHCT